MKKPELLLPAGSPEALQTAFLYGADAVYAGLPSLSLRANQGFTVDTVEQAIRQAHEKNKKIFSASRKTGCRNTSKSALGEGTLHRPFSAS